MRNASATSRRQTKRLNTLEIALVFDVAHRHPASYTDAELLGTLRAERGL